MGNARAQETIFAFGKNKAAALNTEQTGADMWRPGTLLNDDLINESLTTESDAEELGKGHEFATQTFPVSWDVGFPMNCYLSSEMMAWVGVFGLGSVVKSGSGPHVYTCSALDPAEEGIELPSFSFLRQLRPGGAKEIEDILASGLVVEGFRVSVGSGPGRASSMLSIDAVGTGKINTNSGITAPARTNVKLLPSSSLALTVNGTDYVANKNIVSLEWGIQNAHQLEAGFYPGSGIANGAAIRGRMELGARVPLLSFVARLGENSAELASLTAQSKGTAVVSQQLDVKNKYTVTFHQTVIAARTIGSEDGMRTVAVTVSPQYHKTNGLLTLVATTEVDAVGGYTT